MTSVETGVMPVWEVNSRRDEMKTFYTHTGVGRCRYVVSFHDGVKTHRDNSPFFDIRIFSSKLDTQKFVKELLAAGYVQK